MHSWGLKSLAALLTNNNSQLTPCVLFPNGTSDSFYVKVIELQVNNLEGCKKILQY